MKQQLEQSVIRILNSDGAIVGAGFVVADHLAVTCAHVVHAAGSDRGQPISIQFYANSVPQKTQVLYEGWSPFDSDDSANDVSFIRLEQLPDGVVPVVLGTAKGRSRHSFTALGFPYLGGYEDRWADGYLSGVVPALGKRPTLQFEGGKIKEGMSGAPILDLEANRVVGMVCEYVDDTGERFAWATTSDTLIELNPTLRLWPDEYGPKEFDDYLVQLIDYTQTLTLPDGHEIPLEHMYVSLKADEMNAIERQAEHDLYIDDVQALYELSEGAVVDQYTRFTAMRKAIARHPRMFMLTARNWERLFGKREQNLLTITEVIQRHPCVVLLGDPGSGKTTLSKWLVLQFARALKEGKALVRVKKESVEPRDDEDQTDAESLQSLDLGVARLPILLRVADYVRTRWTQESGDTGLSLEQFLKQHYTMIGLPLQLKPESVGGLFRDYLSQQQAFVVLDGLDEVGDPNQRRAVMQAVKKFLQTQLVISTGEVGEQAGNQIIMTSRIVGYQFDPLTHIPHYTLEDMGEAAITVFCQNWMKHVAHAVDADEKAKDLKQTLFDNTHVSVRSLAGNPLLLTILAQLYWKNAVRNLPTRRVELYDEATKTMYAQREFFWKQSRISFLQLSHALSAVAIHIHSHEVSGFVEEGEVREQLGTVLPHSDQIEAVLEAARDASGFLVARGEGVYGFLHRSFQEYFTAKYFINQLEYMKEVIVSRLPDLIWHEPVVLAVGLISLPSYPHSRQRLSEIFHAILNTPDPVGDLLPSRELIATQACLECVRLPPGVARLIVERLLAMHIHHKDTSALLRQSICRVFALLEKSIERNNAETALCNALVSADFEHRYAAATIIFETGWHSRPLAQALVKAWCLYPDPAMSLLSALDVMSMLHEDCFPTDFLPFKQAITNEPHLWTRANTSGEWKAIVKALYLPLAPPNEDVVPTQINRDSPLTPHLLAALRSEDISSSLASFRQYLFTLACKPGTALARDAALALSALGDKSWVETCVKNAGENQSLLRPLFACLTLACFHDLDRFTSRRIDMNPNNAYQHFHPLEFTLTLDRTLELDTVRERIPQLSHISVLAHDLSLSSDIHQTLLIANHILEILETNYVFELFFFRDYDKLRVRAAAHNLAWAFDQDPDRFQEVKQSVKIAQNRWKHHKSYHKELDRVLLTIETFIMIKGRKAEPIDKVRVALIETCLAVWKPTSELPTNPSKIDDQGLTPVTKVHMMNEKLEPGILTPEIQVYGELQAPTEITSDSLAEIVNDLTGIDEIRRQRARQMLNKPRSASLLGKSTIEIMALLSQAVDLQIGPQISGAFERIVYDTPKWVAEWINTMRQAISSSEENTTVEESGKKLYAYILSSRIISSIFSATPETLKIMMNALQAESPPQRPSFRPTESVFIMNEKLESNPLKILGSVLTGAQDPVRMAILHSIHVMTQLNNIPKNSRTELRKLLLSLLDHETNTEVSRLVIEILGYWQEASAVVIKALLVRLRHSTSSPDLVAELCTALARLAARTPKLSKQVSEALHAMYPEPTAAAGLIRLKISETLQEHNITAEKLNQLQLFYTPAEASGILEEFGSFLYKSIVKELPDPSLCLIGLLQAGSAFERWVDSYHSILVNTVRTHIELHPDLLPTLLLYLEKALLEQGWVQQRMLLAVTAACIEVMPIAVQRSYPGDLETLLIQGATNLDSSDSRRFAIRALSYLRTITPAIAQALLLGCQEGGEVQKEVMTAAERFQSIKGDLLPELAANLTGKNAVLVYAIAKLLGALGQSETAEATGLKEQIVDILIAAIEEQSSEREVIISGINHGKLKNALYITLLQVVRWPWLRQYELDSGTYYVISR